MPEGPEVKLTANILDKVMNNKVIINWEYSSSSSDFVEFTNSLPLLVEEVKSKGKIIYLSCFNEYKRFYIVHHMKLTGSWKNKLCSNPKCIIELENKQKLYFYDPKGLATFNFYDNELDFNRALDKLGPDILSNEFTLPIWKTLFLRHKNKNITSFLMDQSIISGCGNYIKAEALYYAKISPLRKVCSLSELEIEELYQGLRIVSRTSYIYNGYYTDFYGKKGKYDLLFKVYNKDHTTKTKTPDGRITYWDERIQI